MNAQDEYIEQASKQLAADIDFEVMAGFLQETGWQRVVLEPMTYEHGKEIDEWVEAHINKSCVIARGLVWLFKNPKDATWFRMKWI